MQGNNYAAPILLIEGNASSETQVLRAYQQTGHKNRILVARSGEHALTLLRGCHKGLAFGLVLLDLYVPRHGGCAVLEAIRRDRGISKVPVVLMCERNEDNDEMQRCSHLANTWVKKPSVGAEWTHLLDRLVSFWLDRRVLNPI